MKTEIIIDSNTVLMVVFLFIIVIAVVAFIKSIYTITIISIITMGFLLVGLKLIGKDITEEDVGINIDTNASNASSTQNVPLTPVDEIEPNIDGDDSGQRNSFGAGDPGILADMSPEDTPWDRNNAKTGLGNWIANEPYSTMYPPVSMPAENPQRYRAEALPLLIPPDGLSYDEKVEFYAKARTRDKKTMDGAVSKTAEYFKKHFDDELPMAEGQVWWGANDY